MSVGSGCERYLAIRRWLFVYQNYEKSLCATTDKTRWAWAQKSGSRQHAVCQHSAHSPVRCRIRGVGMQPARPAGRASCLGAQEFSLFSSVRNSPWTNDANTRARAGGWISTDETALSMRRFDSYRGVAVDQNWPAIICSAAAAAAREAMTLQIDRCAPRARKGLNFLDYQSRLAADHST